MSFGSRVVVQDLRSKDEETYTLVFGDYSDIAAMSAEFWARHRPERSEPKAQVTLRIDQDVLDYFKGGGKGYQTRINDVLRSFVAAHTPGQR